MFVPVALDSLLVVDPFFTGLLIGLAVADLLFAGFLFFMLWVYQLVIHEMKVRNALLCILLSPALVLLAAIFSAVLGDALWTGPFAAVIGIGLMLNVVFQLATIPRLAEEVRKDRAVIQPTPPPPRKEIAR